MAVAPNSRAAIEKRRDAGLLTWRWAALLLFARSIFSFLAQGLVAGVYALQTSSAPWVSAARWLPVYATLIDAWCLALLWRATRHEGIALRDLIGFDRERWRRDVLFGVILIPISLAFILPGIWLSSLVVFGTTEPPALFQPLPLLPALYAVVIFPLVWGFTEETTYNGYLAPRIQVLSGSTAVAVALVAIPWSLQHALQPMTFDPDFMLYRALAPIPFATFITLVYLRVRRLLPFAIAHWLMNGGDAFVTLLLPLIR